MSCGPDWSLAFAFLDSRGLGCTWVRGRGQCTGASGHRRALRAAGEVARRVDGPAPVPHAAGHSRASQGWPGRGARAAALAQQQHQVSASLGTTDVKSDVHACASQESDVVFLFPRGRPGGAFFASATLLPLRDNRRRWGRAGVERSRSIWAGPRARILVEAPAGGRRNDLRRDRTRTPGFAGSTVRGVPSSAQLLVVEEALGSAPYQRVPGPLRPSSAGPTRDGLRGGRHAAGSATVDHDAHVSRPTSMSSRNRSRSRSRRWRSRGRCLQG